MNRKEILASAKLPTISAQAEKMQIDFNKKQAELEKSSGGVDASDDFYPFDVHPKSTSIFGSWARQLRFVETDLQAIRFSGGFFRNWPPSLPQLQAESTYKTIAPGRAGEFPGFLFVKCEAYYPCFRNLKFSQCQLIVPGTTDKPMGDPVTSQFQECLLYGADFIGIDLTENDNAHVEMTMKCDVYHGKYMLPIEKIVVEEEEGKEEE